MSVELGLADFSVVSKDELLSRVVDRLCLASVFDSVRKEESFDLGGRLDQDVVYGSADKTAANAPTNKT